MTIQGFLKVLGTVSLQPLRKISVTRVSSLQSVAVYASPSKWNCVKTEWQRNLD